MEVILLQDVRGVGRKYDIKHVADGYAQNFLLPRKLAERATPERVKKAEGKRTKALAEREMAQSKLTEELKKLSSVRVAVKVPANEQGRLFKSIKASEIVRALEAETRIIIPADSVVFFRPIKAIGEYEILVEAGPNKASFTLAVEKA